MPIWPLSLPQKPRQSGYSESEKSGSLRTKMDKGPDKVRRRFTNSIIPFTLQITATFAQVASFSTFYRQDCNFGATTFTWVHPRTDEAATYRFIGEPVYTPFSLGGLYWNINFKTEIMP